jgi:endonuclease/exonuclease/phosphatase family metal-dependent hydrolase
MLFQSRRAKRRALLVAALCASAVAVLPAAAQAGGTVNDPPKIMTRNLYLGADLNPALGAIIGCLHNVPGACASIPAANQVVWNQVVATNFPERAKLLAREIDDDDPYVVNLQEVALWRSDQTGVPNTTVNPPGIANATNVDYDFLQSLLDELKARGNKYTAAVTKEEADIEGPGTDGRDHRLTMRDVILTRTDLPPGRVSFSNPQRGSYSNILSVPNPLTGGATSIDFKRGWVSIDASVTRKPVLRIVDTHLESASSGIRQQQAGELIGASGPLTDPSFPAIVAGDLNSDSAILPCVSGNPAYPGCLSTGQSDGAALGIITNFGGFTDSANTENTFGHNADLNDFPSNTFSERIDHVLTRNVPFSLTNSVVGDGNAPVYRTPGGLWPSDHGGLIAGLN